jgi:hypothetical protein
LSWGIQRRIALRGKLGKEALLFEKRSKNFCFLARAQNSQKPFMNKSFLVLFFKKERLSLAKLFHSLQ